MIIMLTKLPINSFLVSGRVRERITWPTRTLLQPGPEVHVYNNVGLLLCSQALWMYNDKSVIDLHFHTTFFHVRIIK
jgi:hypothetical protein